jgi:hypothetical protein
MQDVRSGVRWRSYSPCSRSAGTWLRARYRPPTSFGRSFLEMRLNAGVSEPPGAFRDRARAALGFLPASLTIPDLYVVDVAEREPRRFAAPLDRTTYGSFNLLPARLSGGRSLSAKYSTESPPAFGESQMLLRLVFEVKF